MSKRNIYLFNFLQIIAWIIFVGLCIEAGALIVNFIFSIYNPAMVARLYQKLDLSDLYSFSKGAFFGVYSFMLVISILKAYLFYLLIKLVRKINLSRPFSSFVADQITLISYITLSVGLLSYIARQTVKSLQHRIQITENLNHFWADSQAFILMAAIIFVIAEIFKKGIELQTENDLTV